MPDGLGALGWLPYAGAGALAALAMLGGLVKYLAGGTEEPETESVPPSEDGDSAEPDGDVRNEAE